jgi:palmitoyltransferase ZDHHC4
MISFILSTIPSIVLIPCCAGIIASFVICCCVPPSNNEKAQLFNKFSYFLNYEFFDYTKNTFKKIPCGERVWNSVGNLLYWIIYKPNPLLQIVYFVLVFGGFVMMVIVGYPLIPNPYMSEIHKYIAGLVVLGTLYSWYLACTVSPGIITEKNWKTFDNYEYAVIFREGEFYVYPDGRPSIPKLPRSKHDAITDVVVARFDHFCPWLNNPVGERNYRWFIAFLIMTNATLWYGVWASWSIIVTVVVKHNLLQAEFHNRATGETIKASYRIIFQWLMFHYPQIMMLMLLTTIMGIVVTAFMCYHFYLAAKNVTTNESFKWGQFHNYWERHQQRLLAKENNGITPDHSMFQILTCFNCCCGKSIGESPPPNPYNLGWKKNLKQVFWPKSLYNRTKVRFTTKELYVPPKKEQSEIDKSNTNVQSKLPKDVAVVEKEEDSKVNNRKLKRKKGKNKKKDSKKNQ